MELVDDPLVQAPARLATARMTSLTLNENGAFVEAAGTWVLEEPLNFNVLVKFTAKDGGPDINSFTTTAWTLPEPADWTTVPGPNDAHNDRVPSGGFYTVPRTRFDDAFNPRSTMVADPAQVIQPTISLKADAGGPYEYDAQTLTLQLDGSKREGVELSYDWSIPSRNVVVQKSGPMPELSIVDSGLTQTNDINFSLKLTVADVGGETDDDTAHITYKNAAPIALSASASLSDQGINLTGVLDDVDFDVNRLIAFFEHVEYEWHVGNVKRLGFNDTTGGGTFQHTVPLHDVAGQFKLSPMLDGLDAIGIFEIRDRFQNDLAPFSIRIPLPEWGIDADGTWNTPSNWSPAIVPDGNTAVSVARFLDAITAPRTVMLGQHQNIAHVIFDNQNSYTIAGSGENSLNVESAGINSSIEVKQGSHRFQAHVDLNSSTDVIVNEESRLTFDSLNLNGNQITLSGAAETTIANVDAGGGSITVNEGTLSGDGPVSGGTVNVGDAVFSPGSSPISFSIDGSYEQSESSVLEIELGGSNPGQQHDQLVVSGSAKLAGTLRVKFLDGLNEPIGTTFDIISAGEIMGGFNNFDLPRTPGGEPMLDVRTDNQGMLQLVALTALVGTGLFGDFDGSGALDVADIDALAAAIRAGSEDLKFDVDGDGNVAAPDHAFWVKDLKRTWIGDADLNGEFASSDLVLVFQAGKFEQDVDASWAEGDWNGDARFESADFVAAFQDGGYEQGPLAAINSVPEPASVGLLGLGCLTWLGFRRHRYA